MRTGYAFSRQRESCVWMIIASTEPEILLGSVMGFKHDCVEISSSQPMKDRLGLSHAVKPGASDASLRL
jgi:hypothetical protein